MRNVLVTAGAAGIGKAITERHTASGARVHICDIGMDALSALRATHLRITTTVTNIGDPGDVQCLVRDVAKLVGGVVDMAVLPASDAVRQITGLYIAADGNAECEQWPCSISYAIDGRIIP